MSDCKHLTFKAHVDVARIEDIGKFMAEVRVWCEDCGLAFSFKGMEGGLHYEIPRCGPFGLEARLPIEPSKHYHQEGLQ